MFTLNSPEVDFAVDVVRRAGALARRIQAELVTPALTKSDRSPVTVADFAVQALAGCMLEKAFPRDLLVAEEDASPLRSAEGAETLACVAHFVGKHLAYTTPQTACAWIDRGGGVPAKRFWTLDPVDGTKGFLRGDQYVVALALIEDGKVEIGVLGCPNLVNGGEPAVGGAGSVIVAVRGQGTWFDSLVEASQFRPMFVSEVENPAEARVLRSFESGHTNVGQMEELLARMGVQAPPVLMDSQAKYGLLAAGKGDLLFRLLSADEPNYHETIWDQAAGSLIVEEAGGRITDLDGKALDFTAGRKLTRNRGIVASNGKLHALALKALQHLRAQN